MKIIILGATSTIARELMPRLATPADEFLLAARDKAEGEACTSDLHIRSGARTIFKALDATALDSHAAWMRAAIDTLGGLDGVILCFGDLGDPAKARQDWAEARKVIEVNFTAAVALLEPAAAELETRGAGYILALSSVAGERGRQSNYLYGASKAALSVYLEGLAHRLAPKGVRVKIAKLGFVESRMSLGVPMPGPLRTTAASAAERLVRFLKSSRQSAFIPWFWGPIMLIIRSVPTRIFNKTKM
jgi:decaprenylphospho-beta-D-erythro-pentofuranosid-2-ulose 2-reductase